MFLPSDNSYWQYIGKLIHYKNENKLIQRFFEINKQLDNDIHLTGGVKCMYMATTKASCLENTSASTTVVLLQYKQHLLEMMARREYKEKSKRLGYSQIFTHAHSQPFWISYQPR